MKERERERERELKERWKRWENGNEATLSVIGRESERYYGTRQSITHILITHLPMTLAHSCIAIACIARYRVVMHVVGTSLKGHDSRRCSSRVNPRTLWSWGATPTTPGWGCSGRMLVRVLVRVLRAVVLWNRPETTCVLNLTDQG
jgi:hypothetical protein